VAPIPVVAEQLAKVYTFRGHPPTYAVKDVSFTVAAGESMAIVGESGSGKTTIARILMGLESPSSGRVAICGHERTYRSPSKKQRRSLGSLVQMVFQDPYSSLDPRQRIADAIDEVITLFFRLSRSEVQARRSSLLEQVGLDERIASALPRQLSGGQRQRVAIARALAAKPEVLVLDEAVAALDMSIRAQVLNLLADIRERTQISYLFISHDLSTLRQVTDTTLVMRHGEMVEYGATEQVLSEPAMEYTKQLLDSIPVPGWMPRRRAV